MELITVTEFKRIRDEEHILLDVRNHDEFEFCNIGGTHIPLPELEQRYKELDSNKTIFCLCHHGMRSEYAAKFLESIGPFKTVNIVGGIDAWSPQVDPSIARY